MNLDKFSKRSRRGSGDGSEGYDFSRIAQDAVSDMRAQKNADDFWADDLPSDFDPSSVDGLYEDAEPVRERRAFGFGRSRQAQAPADEFDAPIDRSASEGAPVRERKAFGFGRGKQTAPADEFDAPLDRSAAEGAPVRERRPFGFGRGKQTAPADEFDAPLDRSASEGAPVRERKAFGFGRGKQTAPADEFDAPLDRSAAEGAPVRERKAFGFGRGKQTAPADEFDAPIDRSSAEKVSESRGIFRAKKTAEQPSSAVSASPSAPSVPSPPEPSPEAVKLDDAQPERRVFNAATQPNYAYMTDYPEEDQRRTAAQSAGKAASSGVIETFKKNIRTRLGQDEPGVNYYTPPADRAPSQVRRRQKRRNRRPLRTWAKFLIFAIGMLAAFSLILYVAFYSLITGRINYVGESTRNPVYLSVEEYANLSADLTDTEENAAEFTEPLSIAEPNENIKVIMVVASDGRIGDTFDSSGRKRTNNSAKTDAIMLIAIDNQHRRIRVASIMTDTYVRIQDYKTNKLSKAFYYDTANGDYTLPCLHQTIRDNFGVVPDNYIVVDFNAFQILVNRLGGLDVEVSADEAYYMSAHERYGDFPRFNSAGNYKMSGTEALNYVRMRAVGNDDYDRVARQRIVFKQMLSQIGSMSKMELAELAYALLPELPTNMTANQLFNYLTDASDLASYEFNEVTFPITNSWRYGTASVRDDTTEATDNDSVVSGSDLDSHSDPRSTKFTVIVTNFQFNANALQKFLYENDDSYLNGTAANGITVPEIIAPLEIDSPAASIQPST